MMHKQWQPLLRAAQAEAVAFAKAVRDPRAAQLALLQRIVAEQASCEFGQRHEFSQIRDLAEFQRHVPICKYDDIQPAVARIASGEPNVMTKQPVIAFEETGGTSSGAKLIPYTVESLAGFRRAVLPWIAGLAQRRPEAVSGSAYVTIGPATRPAQHTGGGVPIGLGSDAAYLGEELAPAFASLLAVPPHISRITDVESWQIATLKALVSADDLSFVSLWSPTFLTSLLASLPCHSEQLLARLDAAPRRRLDQALADSTLDTERLWPRLDCISCWNDGPSAGFAAQLAALFPHAVIEPKGLLATEAAMTIPYGATGGCVPAISSCFMEFLDEGENAHLCDELVAGGIYRLVITTEGGLYRYDMGDMVECTGHESGLPLLRFAGRAGRFSDMVGEKLTESFVAGALAELGLAGTLAATDDPTGYVLMLDHCAPADRTSLADHLDRRLCDNPQYAHARQMGQLIPLQVVDRPGYMTELMTKGLASGKRMGDFKAVALIPLSAGGEMPL
jgi:hypothetical protein